MLVYDEAAQSGKEQDDHCRALLPDSFGTTRLCNDADKGLSYPNRRMSRQKDEVAVRTADKRDPEPTDGVTQRTKHGSKCHKGQVLP